MPITITLRQLSYFVATAESLNVSRAAKSLRVSQPSVSVAIQQLEDHYQRPLFVRHSGRGMQLTDFGEAQMVQARRVLALARSVDQPPERPGQLTGRLRLGFFINLSPFYAPDALSAFGENHPELEVEIREYDFADLLKYLRDGEIDIAVTFDIGLASDVHRRPLHRMDPYIMLPRGHRLEGREHLGLKDIAGERLILMRQMQSWEYVQQMMLAAGVDPPRVMRPGSFELQRAMVAAGHGVGIAWTRPVGDMVYGGDHVVCRPISGPVPSQHTMMVWHGQNDEFSQLPLARKILADWYRKKDYNCTPEPRS